MKRVLEYGNLPITTITEFVTEIEGEKFPLELRFDNLSREVKSVLGTYILKPGKIYTALSNEVLTDTDLVRMNYSNVPSPILTSLCITPNLYAIPVSQDAYVLAYSFFVIEPVKLSIQNVSFGDIYFEYDDNNMPPFIENRIKEAEELLSEDKKEFSEEHDMEILDKAMDEYLKHEEMREEMQSNSANTHSLEDVFTASVEKIFEGAEKVDIDFNDEEEESESEE